MTDSEVRKISIMYLSDITECRWSESSSNPICIYTSSTSIQEKYIIRALKDNNISYKRGNIYGLYVDYNEVYNHYLSKTREDKINSILKNEK